MVKKVLFVCCGNIDRSPTAEEMYKRCKGFEVKSAGVLSTAPVRVNSDLMRWADIIFAMDEKVRQALLPIEPSVEQKITVLGIPDEFRRHSPKLKKMLGQKLTPFFCSKQRLAT